MAKKETATKPEWSFWGEFFHGIKMFFVGLGKVIKFLLQFVWEILLKMFKLVFYAWGFILLTVVAASVIFFLLSAGVRQLSEIDFVQKITEKSDPVIELYFQKVKTDLEQEILEMQGR